MRLLLLLSALLSALTGVVGTRATAQPMQASVAAAALVPQTAVPSRTALRFSAPGYASSPPLRLWEPRLVSAVTARALYAERRRE